jgi:Pyruvate/2-oxoacid:ferredoxin oxidoreductase delta subunit
MDKRADVIGGFLCRGTCYHPIPCLVGKFPNRPDETDLQKAKEFAGSVLRHLSSGSSGPLPDSRRDVYRHGFGFYNILGAMLKDPMIRFLMPAPKLESDKCTECGWCVAECPTGSMAISKGPEAVDSCIRCYRCLTGCPEKALSVKWGISNFMVWTLYNTTFERWFGDVEPWEIAKM